MLLAFGIIIGFKMSQLSIRYWFINNEYVAQSIDLFNQFSAYIAMNVDLENFILTALLNLPFFSLFGLISGLLICYFYPAGFRYFLVGILVNIGYYLFFSGIQFPFMHLLISPAIEPISRFAEIIFSNLYFTLFYFFAFILYKRLILKVNQSVIQE